MQPIISLSGTNDEKLAVIADVLKTSETGLKGVAALAGSAFGIYGKGHIRLSAANSMENLRRAVELLGAFVEKIRAEKQ